MSDIDIVELRPEPAEWVTVKIDTSTLDCTLNGVRIEIAATGDARPKSAGEWKNLLHDLARSADELL
jgi:hypothetical protein